MKKYAIVLTEDQLLLVARAVEDYHRFLSGQCKMENATSLLLQYRKVREILGTCSPFIAPNLEKGASYDWAGNGCRNSYQRREIAMSYGIYREILHYFAKDAPNWNVYRSETLHCAEQGDPIKIEER